MLSSRRFDVELNNDRSRWRNQKYGLPQGSGYATYIDILIDEVDPTPENYDRFVEATSCDIKETYTKGVYETLHSWSI